MKKPIELTYTGISTSSDIPLISYAVTKYAGRIIGVSIDRQRRACFSLEIDKITLPRIEVEFESGGTVSAKQFANEMRRLFKMVRKEMRGQNVG